MVCIYPVAKYNIYCRKNHICLNNSSNNKSFKQLKMCKTPQILCIQLVRFKKYFVSSQDATSKSSGTRPSLPTTQLPSKEVEKIHTRIDIPTEFELPIRITNQHFVKYDLLAVCNHHGSSPTSGHYTALFLLDGAWWYASDDTVRKVKENEFVETTRSHSYLLFYSQKENVCCFQLAF